MSERAHGCSQASAPRSSSCKSQHRGVRGDRAQHPASQAVGRAAFWGERGHPVLPGGRPLRGHRALPTCLPRRHAAGGGVALFISLLRHKQVRGAAARARFLGCRRRPQAASTSSESVELHAAKTSLATGAPGQRAARNSAQTVGKEHCSICPGDGHHPAPCFGGGGLGQHRCGHLPWAGTLNLRDGVFLICSAPRYGTLSSATVPCHASPRPGRGVPRAGWQRGPKPLRSCSGPSPCVGTDRAGDD